MKEDHVERSLSMDALQYAASHLLYVAGIRKQDIAFDGLTALAGGISVRFCAPRENAAGYFAGCGCADYCFQRGWAALHPPL